MKNIFQDISGPSFENENEFLIRGCFWACKSARDRAELIVRWRSLHCSPDESWCGFSFSKRGRKALEPAFF